MHQPELLAPAGDLEKLQTALRFGADAVYLGAARFGLRALAGNFTLEDLATARDLCRRRGKKLYLTLNAWLRPAEYPDFEAFVEELRPLDLDAYIVADPGVIAAVRRVDPHRVLHLSTQANTTSAQGANFWAGFGVARVNLARELSLDEIALIRAQTRCELEVFVHGAMCVAWSGRCLLSAALTGREANRGLCAHPCRWRYALVEETRPGEYFPVEEDERGTYLFNSRDLCLLEHLPALVTAGVDSLKIEGRMKSIYYLAAVTRIYRAALDAYGADPAGYRLDLAWRAELDKVSHRPYGTGFLLGGQEAGVHAADSTYIRACDFVGVVREEQGALAVQGRNRFLPGENLEIIGPGMRTQGFQVGAIRSLNGDPLAAGQPNSLVRLALPPGTQPGDLLRRPVF
ncbi:peptidase U32 family protein [Geoalkalibacter halelectricus]|uniref:U32 family peptidase n=1 Tax=Geoalkalibacter halelectricus TaxID=2847045 RepID=A0ABY5ZM90_9BACT|nr:U32 family peptidase [Geoalkalibacter halelectricus]MDO3378952.1 U32 family peptidase [Geoalkalibacter halelectricus]UWZ79025.1 U32 family peptidase [Geoalkalibacter halelectricus]